RPAPPATGRKRTNPADAAAPLFRGNTLRRFDTLQQGLALFLELAGKVAPEATEQFLLLDCLASRFGGIDRHDLGEAVLGERQARPVEVLVLRHKAERALDRLLRAAMDAIDDPLQHAHIVAEARPGELAGLVLPEPVHAIDARQLLDAP